MSAVVVTCAWPGPLIATSASQREPSVAGRCRAHGLGSIAVIGPPAIAREVGPAQLGGRKVDAPHLG